MENKFQECVERKRIVPFSRGPKFVAKELKLANFDLSRANISFREKDYKWATVQIYYSMFHSARALLYAKSYREKSHWCLIEAIRNFYVKEGKIGFWSIEALEKAKVLREEADYYGEFTEENAKELLNKGKEFFNKAKEILVIYFK